MQTPTSAARTSVRRRAHSVWFSLIRESPARSSLCGEIGNEARRNQLHYNEPHLGLLSVHRDVNESISTTRSVSVKAQLSAFFARDRAAPRWPREATGLAFRRRPRDSRTRRMG